MLIILLLVLLPTYPLVSFLKKYYLAFKPQKMKIKNEKGLLKTV